MCAVKHGRFNETNIVSLQFPVASCLRLSCSSFSFSHTFMALEFFYLLYLYQILSNFQQVTFKNIASPSLRSIGRLFSCSTFFSVFTLNPFVCNFFLGGGCSHFWGPWPTLSFPPSPTTSGFEIEKFFHQFRKRK